MPPIHATGVAGRRPHPGSRPWPAPTDKPHPKDAPPRWRAPRPPHPSSKQRRTPSSHAGSRIPKVSASRVQSSRELAGRGAGVG